VIDFVQGDVFDVDLPAHGFTLVYADPPYANCRYKYARRNKSRQWGISARADFWRHLVARMEALRSPEGACAVSLATPELRLMSLFPSDARVCAWVKNWAQFRPGVWPTFAWEPLIVWGERAHWKRDGAVARIKRPGGVPFDWLELNPTPRRDRKHETPKPDGFGDWVLDLTLGNRTGRVCELFAGTGPIVHAAVKRGSVATAVDFDNYIQ
jgi:hypothetical protein